MPGPEGTDHELGKADPHADTSVSSLTPEQRNALKRDPGEAEFNEQIKSLADGAGGTTTKIVRPPPSGEARKADPHGNPSEKRSRLELAREVLERFFRKKSP